MLGRVLNNKTAASLRLAAKGSAPRGYLWCEGLHQAGGPWPGSQARSPPLIFPLVCLMPGASFDECRSCISEIQLLAFLTGLLTLANAMF